MKYNICKECEPTETVEKIKSILKDNNIPVNEGPIYCDNDKYSPVSLRTYIAEINQLGTNGKGNCINNAKASAYAELMERIQNQSLLQLKGDDYIYAPDEEIYNINNINDNILNEFNINNLQKLSCRIYKNTSEDKVIMLPFYNIKEKSVKKLPIQLLFLLQGTSGMAAGNTIEEAFVQGFSEICERYSYKYIALNSLSLPSIPEDEYIKYDNIKNLINYYEQRGYKIHVKDASLGKNIPAVCILTEDLNNNLFYVNFGAHPSLPVAIERTLTEFVQGFILSDKDFSIKLKLQGNYFPNRTINYEKEDINLWAERLIQATAIYENSEYIRKIFFNDKTEYSYNKGTWIHSEEKISNKELMNFMLKNLYKITENNIYVRDVSFLGFPSIQIFIPTMSVLYSFDDVRIKQEDNLYTWARYIGQNDDEYNDFESLQSAIEYRCSLGFSYYLEISNIPCEYLALLCAVIKNNKEKVEKYSNIILDRNKYKKYFNEKGITRIKIIQEYFKNKDNTIENITSKYAEQDIQDFYKLKDNLSFQYIKDLILKFKINRPINADIDNSVKMLIKSLHDKYKNCTPKQIELSKFI